MSSAIGLTLRVGPELVLFLGAVLGTGADTQQKGIHLELRPHWKWLFGSRSDSDG